MTDDLHAAGDFLRNDMTNRTRVVAPTNGTNTSKGKVNPDSRIVTATPVSAIKPEAVDFLWDRRIPLRALSLLAGEGGLGKSTLTLELAARLSRGELDGALRGQPVDVLLVTAEDAAASVVAPRLIAAQGDPDRVHILNVEVDGYAGLLSLPGDLPMIEARTREAGARVLIIDPIVATLAAGTDSHNDQDVRQVLAPVAQFAERHDLAVIGVMHLNKSEAKSLMQRVSGSIGFVNAARSVLAFARDPEDADGDQGSRRVIVQSKSNWGRYAPSLACRIESVELEEGRIPTSRLVIEGECELRGEDLTGGEDARLEVDDAIEFLAEALGDGEWHHSTEVKAEARRTNIRARTLQRAGKRLKWEVRRGFQGRTDWRLPSAPSPNESLGASKAGAIEQTRMVKRNPGGSDVHPRQPSEVAWMESEFEPATPEQEELLARLGRDGAAS